MLSWGDVLLIVAVYTCTTCSSVSSEEERSRFSCSGWLSGCHQVACLSACVAQLCMWTKVFAFVCDLNSEHYRYKYM